MIWVLDIGGENLTKDMIEGPLLPLDYIHIYVMRDYCLGVYEDPVRIRVRVRYDMDTRFFFLNLGYVNKNL